MRHQEPGQSVVSVAEVYEQSMVPAAFALRATDLLALLALPPGSRVLDVACGTGIVARTAVHHTGATGVVVGLDLHAGMLAVARAQAPTGAWVQGSASALPFPSSAFDVVVCQQGLQFFPDRLTALREMYLTFRTLFYTSAANFAEPLVEREEWALYPGSLRPPNPFLRHCFLLNHNFLQAARPISAPPR